MKFKYNCFIFSCFVIAFGSAQATINKDPKYASSKTKKVIEKMIEAHGGLEKWRNAPTISFHSHLKVDFGKGNWVSFWEECTVETNTRRAYTKLPNQDNTFGRIAFDGHKAWSVGNLQGIAKAPARFTAWRNFYLFNIPWLTQDSGVKLGEPGKEKLALPKLEEKEYITVGMTFDNDTGDTPKDWYTLYIDPDTYQLRAAEYNMTYASMLRGGAKSNPPSIFVWEQTETINGLVVPARYTVYWSANKSVAVKDGAISNWSFNKPFDESQMEMPSGGKLDKSIPMKMD